MVTMGGATDTEALEAGVLAALVEARSDLERVRTVLTDRDRGTTGSQEVLEVVASHWRRHGAAHRTVWRLVGEEVRGALLAELHGWKRQLREQLHAEQGGDAEQGGAESPQQGGAASAAAVSLEHLRVRLSHADPGLDRTELLIELAELHADHDDHPEAEALFRSAEQDLESYQDRASGEGIAEALMTSLPAMLRGDATEARAEIESLVRASQLLQRTYEGLIQVATEAEEVRRYVERRRALEEKLARDLQDDLVLKRRLVDELSQRLGTTAPDVEEPDEP